MFETRKIKSLREYLQNTKEDEIVVQTSFINGGWHDNEFDAEISGFNIYRFINPELEEKHLFPECYRLTRVKK